MQYNTLCLDTNEKARKMLETHMKKLRERVFNNQKENKDRFENKVVSIDKRTGMINGRQVERIVFFLKGTGCSQIKRNGGCTCCGFYSISNLGEKISDKYYMEKIDEIIEEKSINISNYEIVCLYNDGSLLNEEEFSLDVLMYIVKKLNKLQNIKRIVIEAKVNDITEEKLSVLRSLTNKEFEITVGYESADESVRQLCVNRPFSNKAFEYKIKMSKAYDIDIVPLLMVKPAFLSEREAVEDFLKSLKYLEKFQLARIDMELPTVMKDTLNYELWKINKYKPISFWSVIEILKEREKQELVTPLYISPMVYSVAAVDKAHTCEKCSKIIYELFQKYNKDGNITIFEDLKCDCKKEWEKEFYKPQKTGELALTVIKTLKELEGR